MAKASENKVNQRVGNITSVSGKVTIAGGDVYEGYTVEQVTEIIQQLKTQFQPKPFDGRCPYKGLEVFKEEDTEFFFGREALVEDLVLRVQDSRSVFITGPSGSGKSSLIRAGLIPALKAGAIQKLHSERWLYEILKPGREPLGELARVASSITRTLNAGEDIRTKGLTDGSILAQWCEIALKDDREKRAVLFIDQFEEFFTQISKEAERLAFLNLLTHAATFADGRVILLFAMRSDFLPYCANYHELNALLNQQFIQIGPMRPQELVSAIVQPALRVGLQIDPDLIAQIIYDMLGAPGALPLMQFALKDLFDTRQAQGGLIALTLYDYNKHGGIHEALERHADASFAKLKPNEQELARFVFSALIEVDQATRRTAQLKELVPANADAEIVREVIQKLADARLITTEEADNNKYTITHEKLITAWPWLEKLIKENRKAIALQNEIANDAKEWDDNQRDLSYLYRGARLANAREQLEANNIVLSGLAQAFIEAAIKANTDELEAATQRAAQWRLRSVFLSVALGAVLVAVVVAVFLWNQSRQQATISRSQALAANSQLQKSKHQLSLLLALEAFNVAANLPRSVRLSSEQAVRDSLSQVSGLPLVGHEGEIYTLAFSQAGRWLATGSLDTTVRLWYMSDLTAAPIVLRGHESFIFALAFSPDERWLATGSLDKTVRLWYMSDLTAAPIVLRGHANAISTLAFSPDGRWLATGSWDNTVRLWNVNNSTAEPIVLRGDQGTISTLAFSSDGRWLATASDDATAYLWDMSDPTAEPLVLGGPSSAISTLAFSPDGRWLATGSDNSTAYLWDMNNPTAKPFLLGRTGSSIESLTFSSDGHWLATGSRNGTVRLWDMNNPAGMSTELRGHEGAIYTLAFSQSGRWLATRSTDGTGRLWEMSNLTVSPIVLHGIGNGLAFSPDERWLGAGSGGNLVRLWEINNIVAEPIVLRGHQNAIPTLALSSDGHWLATGSTDTTARLWDMKDPTAEPIVLRGHKDVISALALSSDGRWLATGSTDTTACLWDMKDPRAEPIILHGHKGPIRTLAFSPDGRWLATGSTDTTARLWDMKDPTAEPVVLHGEEGLISILAFSPDGHWLATGITNGTARLWDMKDPRAEPIMLRGQEGESLALAFSPDGSLLATAIGDAAVRLWDMKNPTAEPLVLRRDQGSVYTLNFSPDGRWLATGSGDGDPNARLWDMKDPTAEPIVLRGHENDILILTFSSDGRWLATGSSDNTARLWDMKDPTAEPIEPIVLRGHAGDIYNLAFTPDGHWLATGSADATVRLWTLNINRLVVTACQLVGRNFYPKEWKQYFTNAEYRKTCEQWPLGQN